MAIVAAVVGAARTIAAAGGVIGNITGSAPKDFAKFNRALGPLMKAQAQVTGVSTFAYWHDDVVAMDGQTLNFRIVGSPGSLNLAEIVFRQEAERLGRIWVFRCQSNTDFNSVDSMNATCFFQDTRAAGFEGPPDNRGIPGYDPGPDPGLGSGSGSGASQAGFLGGLTNSMRAVLAGGALALVLGLLNRR